MTSEDTGFPDALQFISSMSQYNGEESIKVIMQRPITSALIMTHLTGVIKQDWCLHKAEHTLDRFFYECKKQKKLRCK